MESNSPEDLQTLDNIITINEETPPEENQNKIIEEPSSPFEAPQNEDEDKQKVENFSETELKKEGESSSSSSYIDKLLCIFSFIRPYFKVTFNDIKTRIKYSFIPIRNDFYKIAENNPDLYGPFWIYTTLIYVIAAGGALSYYFTNSANNYFQMFVPVAGSILYSFGFGFPFALWLSMKIFKIDMKYVSLICLYGYSLCCLIPVLILCSTGFGWIQWIFLTYGILNSTAFILINIWNLIRDLEKRNKYTFLGILCGGQFILFLILKFYFFGSFKASDAPEILNNSPVQNNNAFPSPTPPTKN